MNFGVIGSLMVMLFKALSLVCWNTCSLERAPAGYAFFLLCLCFSLNGSEVRWRYLWRDSSGTNKRLPPALAVQRAT